MLVLFDTAAGLAIFKVQNEKRLKKIENLFQEFQTPEGASSIVQLIEFRKFKDSVEALQAANATVEGKVSKPLKKLLSKLVSSELQEELVVADSKLAVSIKEKFNLTCNSSNKIQELMRCIRSQSESLLSGISKKEMAAYELSLGHSLSRYKLKFSPDKVDTMVVQAIKILDELDKKINNNFMTVKQWYGWHFPELEKNISDNMTMVRTIQKIGFRVNTETVDLSEVLPDGLDSKLKQEAAMSIGTDISDEDLEQVMNMCEEVIMWSDARAELYDYLKNRMAVIAPNLTLLVGELVGARLIAHAGSLLNLAKHPASTVQILGAEKALFRALKTKHDTPKYGIIYHASLVGQCNPKYKGKISRVLSAKVALAIRYDALAEDSEGTNMAIDARAKVERMILALDDEKRQKLTGSGKKRPNFDKYENKSVVKTVPFEDEAISTKRKSSGDTEPPAKKIKVEEVLSEPSASASVEKKKKKKQMVEETSTQAKTESTDDIKSESEKKSEKKKRKHESGDASVAPIDLEELETKALVSEKKKKKKLDSGDASFEIPQATEESEGADSSLKKKKKKKKQD